MCRRGQRGNWQQVLTSFFHLSLSAVCLCDWQALCAGESLKQRSVCSLKVCLLHQLFRVAVEAVRTEQRGSQEHHEVRDGVVPTQRCILPRLLFIPQTYLSALARAKSLIDLPVIYKPIVNHHCEHSSWYLKVSRQDGLKMPVWHF